MLLSIVQKMLAKFCQRTALLHQNSSLACIFQAMSRVDFQVQQYYICTCDAVEDEP
ncbi:hypothetical protein D918_02044 [Trichuris suis]|nr:hypothetical protein D918_02044 [Trichuris suis]